MKRRIKKWNHQKCIYRKVGFSSLKYLAHCPTSPCPASWKWTQSTFSSAGLLLPKAFTTCQSFSTFPSIWAVASGCKWDMMAHVSIVLTWLWRQEVRRDADLLGELNYTYRDWEQRPLGNGDMSFHNMSGRYLWAYISTPNNKTTWQPMMAAKREGRIIGMQVT